MAYSDDFAAAVKRAIGNRSNRQLAPKVGVSATYIGDMAMGRVPKPDVIQSFAEATGADADELLRLAGEARMTAAGLDYALPKNGYAHVAEPRAEYTPDLMTINVSARDLLPEDEAEIQRLADELREKRRSERGEG